MTMKFNEQFSIGDKVVITKEGARQHRHYQNAQMLWAGPLGAFAGLFSQHVEAGTRGVIIDKKPRNFGQGGFDYQVQWDSSDIVDVSWHLSAHLEKDTSGKPFSWRAALYDDE